MGTCTCVAGMGRPHDGLLRGRVEMARRAEGLAGWCTYCNSVKKEEAHGGNRLKPMWTITVQSTAPGTAPHLRRPFGVGMYCTTNTTKRTSGFWSCTCWFLFPNPNPKPPTSNLQPPSPIPPARAGTRLRGRSPSRWHDAEVQCRNIVASGMGTGGRGFDGRLWLACDESSSSVG